jgi:hypothetical protein
MPAMMPAVANIKIGSKYAAGYIHGYINFLEN